LTPLDLSDKRDVDELLDNLYVMALETQRGVLGSVEEEEEEEESSAPASSALQAKHVFFEPSRFILMSGLR